jgi:hypothetical protein
VKAANNPASSRMTVINKGPAGPLCFEWIGA